jgi:diphthamide biosynthesis protein 2
MTKTNITALDRAYSLNYISRVLTLRGSKRIALQFPDESLKDSPSIVRALKSKLESSFMSTGELLQLPHLYVLGDTTFGSCCVDEVAAEHTKCDLIVHFGHSCLSSVSITPTIFVFGRNIHAGNQQVLGQVARALTHEVFLSFQVPNIADSPEQPSPSSSCDVTVLEPPSPSPRVLFLWDPDCTFIVPRILESIASGLKLVENVANYKNKQEEVNTSPSQATNVDNDEEDVEEKVLMAVTSGCKWDTCDNLLDDLNDEIEDANKPFEFLSPHSSIFIPTLRRTSDPNTSSSSSSSSSSPSSSFSTNNTSICGFLIPTSLLSSFKTVVYLGSKPTRCRALIASFAGTADVIQVDPSHISSLLKDEEADVHKEKTSTRASTLPRGSLISVSGGRLMSQRYRMVEAIRSASTLGILAGTLGVDRHVEVIETLRSLINDAGKTSYTVLVGKPNPAKLGNFPEVDVFILVACPESTLLDDELAATFPRPVATPHEAIVALNGWNEEEEEEENKDGITQKRKINPGSSVWTGQSRFDFSDLLLPKETSLSSTAASSSSSSAATSSKQRSGSPPPQHSLLSGRMIPKRMNAIIDASGNQTQPSADYKSGVLTTTTDSAILAVTHDGSAGSFLTTKRTWRGLEYDVSSEVASSTEIVEGHRGVASRYDGEGKPGLPVPRVQEDKKD